MFSVGNRTLALVVAIGCIWAGTANAHHSFAMFDRKVLAEVSGTVKEMQWTNPHVYLDVVSSDNGETTTWTFEAGSPIQLEAVGMKKDTFKTGDKVTVRMHPLKNGAAGGQLVALVTAAGKQYSVDNTPPPEAKKDPGR
jgi:hypothetical protein